MSLLDAPHAASGWRAVRCDPEDTVSFSCGDGMNSVNRLVFERRPSDQLSVAPGVNPGYTRLPSSPPGGPCSVRIGEGSGERTPSIPGRSPASSGLTSVPGRRVVGEPVDGGPAGDIHLGIELVETPWVSSFLARFRYTIVLLRYQRVHVLVNQRRRVVDGTAGEADEHLVRQVGQPLLRRHDGIPYDTTVVGILPSDAGAFRAGGILVQVQIAELHAGDGLEANLAGGLKS